MSETYPPISDWSFAARHALLAEHRTVIRLLLDESFSTFADHQSLAAFGFTDDDPVAQAVDWCLQRFAQAELDPSRLRSTSRSFRLFTEVGFWLAQKVGGPRYRSILKQLGTQQKKPADTAQEAGMARRATENYASGRASERQEAVLDALANRLGSTLYQLRVRTCSDMVGFWLQATEQERADWLGWRSAGLLSEDTAQRSKKDRSLYRSSALFRFQCLHRRVNVTEADHLGCAVAEHTLLQACDNTPPYRRTDQLVLAALPALSGTGVRSLRRLLKEGCASYLHRLLGELDQIPAGEQQRCEWALLHRALSLSTLHALDLDADPELNQRIRQLPDPLAYLESFP